MKKFFSRILFTVAGILILPLAIGLARGFLLQLSSFSLVGKPHIYFISGFGAYLCFQFIFRRPIVTYVFGHELTHALVGWIMGGDIKRFRVSKRGGTVLLTKANFLVLLAPYFIPIYVLGLIGVWYLAGLFFSFHSYRNWLFAGVGFLLSFHLALTLFALRSTQKDITAYGRFFSLIFVVSANFIVIVFILWLLFPEEIVWKRFWQDTWMIPGRVLRLL